MTRVTTSLLAVLAGACTVIACNLSDPIAAPPDPDCTDRSDCNGHGECTDEGVCECDEGYRGGFCSACDVGYLLTDANTCIAPNSGTNNGSNNMCDDGQVMLDGACVEDLCADNPCGIGTCSQTDGETYQCSCPDGSTGDSCPQCDDETCVNGTCNTDTGLCECDGNFDGPTCEECAPGYEGADCQSCVDEGFGADCTTCEQLYDAEPWWDEAYAGRRAIVVFNPAPIDVARGVHVPVTVDHETLVGAGAMMNGRDVRLVSEGDEIDRVLAPDSGWNRPDTTILFANPAQIDQNDFNVVFAYSVAQDPAPPMNDVKSVLLPTRGWAYDGENPDLPLYSVRQRSSGALSIQFRQVDVQAFEAYVYDASDSTQGFNLEIINSMTDMTVTTESFGDVGNASAPGEEAVEILNLPPTFRVTIESLAGEPIAHWLGPTEYTAGTGFTQSRTFSRQFPTGPRPQVMLCDPQLQP